VTGDALKGNVPSIRGQKKQFISLRTPVRGPAKTGLSLGGKKTEFKGGKEGVSSTKKTLGYDVNLGGADPRGRRGGRRASGCLKGGQASSLGREKTASGKRKLLTKEAETWTKRSESDALRGDDGFTDVGGKFSKGC